MPNTAAAPEPLAEQEAIHNLKLGNLSGLNSLYKWYAERLYRSVAGFGVSPSMAEDVVHDTFAKVWDKRAAIQFRDGGIFPLIRRMAINHALDILRRRNKVVVYSDTYDIGAADVDYAGPLDELVLAEKHQMIQETLAKLKPKYAAVIRLRMLEGKSPAETAVELGVEPNNVNQRLHRALKLFSERWPPR